MVNATSSIAASTRSCRRPSCCSAGKISPAAFASKIQSDYERARAGQPLAGRKALTSSSTRAASSARRRRRNPPCGPAGRRPRPASRELAHACCGSLPRCRATRRSCSTRWSSPSQYSFYNWDGIGPATPAGLQQLRSHLHPARAAHLDPQRLRADRLLHRHPGAARPGRRRAHPRDQRPGPSARLTGPSCSSRRSSRWSARRSRGPGCTRRAAWSTRCCGRSGWARTQHALAR